MRGFSAGALGLVTRAGGRPPGCLDGCLVVCLVECLVR